MKVFVSSKSEAKVRTVLMDGTTSTASASATSTGTGSLEDLYKLQFDVNQISRGIAAQIVAQISANMNGSNSNIFRMTAPTTTSSEKSQETTITTTSNVQYSEPLPKMEILYKYIVGDDVDSSAVMTLKNPSGDTNYSVFTSIYFGYTGDGVKDGGTYDGYGTSYAMGNIVITYRESSSFNYEVRRNTDDNVNIFLVFLVVYGVSDSSYPSNTPN